MIHQFHPAFGTHSFQKDGGIGQIGHNDRDIAFFPFDRMQWNKGDMTRRNLSQVLVRLKNGIRIHLKESRPTHAAETEIERVGKITGEAGDGQAGPADAAKMHFKRAVKSTVWANHS